MSGGVHFRVDDVASLTSRERTLLQHLRREYTSEIARTVLSSP